MSFDLSSLGAALPSPLTNGETTSEEGGKVGEGANRAEEWKPEEEKREAEQEEDRESGKKVEAPPLKLTVLSWNIDGSHAKGMAKCRKWVVPAVIDDVKPHVMLLQEIPTREILTTICNNRYSFTSTSSGPRKEAAVVYSRNDFEYLPQSIQQIAGQHLPNEDQQKIELLCERTATVRLQHRTGRKTFLFFSFHNINIIGQQYDTTPKEMATLFCTLVQNVAETERDTQVVCGADFNYCRDGFFEGMGSVPITINVPHTLVHHDDIRRRVRVPDYDPTDRRKFKDKIDYFVLRNIAMNNDPAAHDMTKYHIPDSSVPHDPLVYVWPQPTETTD